MWRPQVDALQVTGWRTIAIDPPGHGQSPGPGRTFTIDECAQCALQVLDAALVKRPVAMLGSSWGGMVAPRLALQAPERVERLVLFNTTAEKPPPLTAVNATLLTWMLRFKALDETTTNILVASNFSEAARQRDPTIGEDIKRNVKAWDRRQMIDTVRSVLIDRNAVLDVISAISVPVLVVSGSEDKILPTHSVNGSPARFPELSMSRLQALRT